MGFKIGRTFVLEFHGTDLEGAVVKMRSASTATVLDLQGDEINPRSEAEIFAKHIIEWNLDDEDDKPLPVSAESVLRLEVPVRNLIFGEWMKATRGITAPLDHRSMPTEMSSVDSIPMQEIPLP
jgi:hypothetical protein